jgi:hypothetical protein
VSLVLTDVTSLFQQSLAQQKGLEVIETSAKDGTNIDAAFHKLTAAILKKAYVPPNTPLIIHSFGSHCMACVDLSVHTEPSRALVPSDTNKHCERPGSGQHEALGLQLEDNRFCVTMLCLYQ